MTPGVTGDAGQPFSSPVVLTAARTASPWRSDTSGSLGGGLTAGSRRHRVHADARFELRPREVDFTLADDTLPEHVRAAMADHQATAEAVAASSEALSVALPMETPKFVPPMLAARTIMLERPLFVQVPPTHPPQQDAAASGGATLRPAGGQEEAAAGPVDAGGHATSLPRAHARLGATRVSDGLSREALGLPAAPAWLQSLRDGSVRLPGGPLALKKLAGPS